MEIIAPGVEHAFFAPGEQAGARRALGYDLDRPLLLFVGRIQPLKGPDVAVRALAELGRRDAQLVIVGGASGDAGGEEASRIRALVDELDLHDRVHFVEPQPHHILSTYYRAADVVLVPSRSESFGLVALEAAACGIPVVASAVGGLLSLVDDHVTGRLIEGRDPSAYARAVAGILDDDALRRSMSLAAVDRAKGYTWSFAAARLRRLYSDLTVRERVSLHMIDAFDPQQLAVLERQIDEWLAELHHGSDHIVAIDRATDGPVRWYVRMRGEEKEFTTVWLTLGQRTLRYETYVLPAPEENAAELYENLLRRNERLVGAHFSIGIEDAVFLRGEMPAGTVSLAELDRALGTLYAQVEQCFQGFLRIAFASRFSS